MSPGFPVTLLRLRPSCLSFFLLLIVVCPPTRADQSLVGATTANFLKIGTHAQAVGLGEAVSALGEGIAFVGYNPASADLRGMTLSATHTLLYEGVQLDDVRLGIPFGKKGGLWVGGKGIFFDKTERTDATGNITGAFTASSFSAGAGIYAHVGRVSVGIFGKSIQQKIDTVKSTTLAADAGIRYRTPLPNVSIGVAALNIGRPAKWIAGQDELPRVWRVGLAYDNGFLKLAVDGVQYTDQAAFAVGGAELTLLRSLKLRAGYGVNSEVHDGFKAGIGFRFSALELDYAFNPGNDFGDAHRMTLTVR